MPNRKVVYFKPIEDIKKKFAYIKYKDLIDFDSANSICFQFNLFVSKIRYIIKFYIYG